MPLFIALSTAVAVSASGVRPGARHAQIVFAVAASPDGARETVTLRLAEAGCSAVTSQDVSGVQS